MGLSGILAINFLLVVITYSQDVDNVDSLEGKMYLFKRMPISSQNIYLTNDDTLNALLSGMQVKRGLPISMTGDKRAIPMSGGIYGKRSMPLKTKENKRSPLPFSGGIYGKRAMNIPFSGGIYGKRSISLRSVPMSGGIYG